MLAAGLLGWPLGFAYSYLMKWIPFIYLNFFLTLGYGALFAFGTSLLLKYGRVRNTPVAVLIGFTVGLIALYFEWNGHVHALVRGAPLLCRPEQVWSVVKLLYVEGSWSFHGSNITGIALALVWSVEALIIVGFCVYLPGHEISDTPFCETTRVWLEQEKKINTLAPFTDPAQIAALKAGDLMPLVEAKPKREGADFYTRLVLKHSPRCPLFFTLRIQNVTHTWDAKGNSSEKIEALTRDLILPSEMFDLIEKFAAEMPAENPASSSGSA